MKKKLCSVILVCSLILCVLPFNASAGGGDGIVLYCYDAETLERIDGLFDGYDFSEMMSWPFTFEQPDGTTLITEFCYPDLDRAVISALRIEISQLGMHKVASFPVPDGYEIVKVFELQWTEQWSSNAEAINEDNIGTDNFTITQEDLTEYENGFFTKNVGILLQKSGTAVHPIAEVPSAWATEQISAAVEAGIVPAFLQSKYLQATTRAEFCALAVALYETATGEEISERLQFNDTSDINVQKMGALGVVAGVGDGNFAPDQKLTREQAATMLSRLANAIEKPLTEQAATFSDNSEISSWAADAVGQMQATGIMGGVGNNTFAPKADYTREQSIATMMRLFDIVK